MKLNAFAVMFEVTNGNIPANHYNTEFISHFTVEFDRNDMTNDDDDIHCTLLICLVSKNTLFARNLQADSDTL